MKTQLTANLLKELLDYDDICGVFYWRVAAGRHGRIPAGNVAGHLSRRGYVEIGICGALYRAHRLAFLYMTGGFPSRGFDIDHINRNKSDNRWENLRLASRTQNNANSGAKKNNLCGIKGVRRGKKPGTWLASICVARETIHLGSFLTSAEASAAYAKAAELHYGKFAHRGEMK